MSTIIRIKRRFDDDPLEAVVLACKRRKFEEGDLKTDDSFTKVLNLSGTIQKKDDNVTTRTIQSLSRVTDSRCNFKTHTPDLTSKNRRERQEQSEKNRLKVVNCFRTLHKSEEEPGGSEDDLEDSPVTIVDVNQCEVEEGKEEDPPSHYVYDLYYTDVQLDDDFSDMFIDNLLSVHPVAHAWEYRTGEDDPDDALDPEDDDSNDENNWRNDYPDSDNSIDEDDMRLAAGMRGLGVDEGYDLSSDSGEEEYPNYEAEDVMAMDLGGVKYAAYKAKLRRELPESDSDHSSDNAGYEDEY